jgi:hypothetical protein
MKPSTTATLRIREQSDTALARELPAAPMVIATLSLAFAIHLRDGEYSRQPHEHGAQAMALLTVSLIANAIAVIGPRFRGREIVWPRGLTRLLLGSALLLQFLALFITWPGVDLPRYGGMQLVPFYVGLTAAAALVLFGSLMNFPRFRVAWFPILLAVFGLLGIWMVHSSPQPHIDVWLFQQEGPAALLHGHNPYAMTFPDIYHSTLPGHQQVYGTGLVQNDRLQFGFPYPPVSLLLATFGYAVAGDHRYAQVFALVLAGTFMGYSRSGRLAMLAAALFLFTPRVFFVLGRGWTEPFVVMLLAATIFSASRRLKWLPVALGLLLAVPLTFFLLPTGWRWRDWFDLLWKTALVTVVATVPFAAADFHAFWKSTVQVQELAPFRWDALSYLVWYGFRGHLVTEPSTALFWSMFAALAALALSLWRSPRTPAGFAASLSLLSLGFFAFNKQAFCNYYFFVIGAMCCAIAACADENRTLLRQQFGRAAGELGGVQPAR